MDMNRKHRRKTGKPGPGGDMARLEAMFRKAQSDHQAGDLKAAGRKLKKIRKIQPDIPEVLHLSAIVAMEDGNPAEAVEHLRRAIRKMPDAADLWNLLGAALQAVGNATDAVQVFEKAIHLDPNCAGAHFNLAKLLSDSETIGEADHHFKRAIAGMPGDYDAHIVYAEFLIENAALREAQKILRLADGLAREKDTVHFLSGRACAGLGMLDEALEHFLTVVKMHPNSTRVYVHIGCVLKAMEETSAEIPRLRNDILDKLRSLAPQSPGPDLLVYWFDFFSASRTADGHLPATRKIPTPEDEAVTVASPPGRRKHRESLPELPENMVVLLHWGRSGSGFFHSLVDGHPQVSTLPGYYFADFFGKHVWESISSPRIDEMVERFIDCHELLFDAGAEQPPPGFKAATYMGANEGYTKMGENGDQTLKLDRKAFARNLNSLLAGRECIDRGTFFRSVHLAHDKTLGRDAGQTHIFYHIHSPNNHAMLSYLRHFPETRIMMTVREPVQNMESWVASAIDDVQHYEDIIDRIVGFFIAFDRPFFSTFPSRGVRLEDIKFKTDETIDALCEWLGIGDDPALRRPTFQGLKWWGDPSTKRFGRTRPVIGFAEDELDSDTDPVKRKIGYLFSERDQFILRTMFYPVSVMYGYTEPDEATFKRDLKAVRPMLDDAFDFEKTFNDSLILEKLDFERNSSSRFLRNVLRDRWEVLNAAGTYPGTIPPLL